MKNLLRSIILLLVALSSQAQAQETGLIKGTLTDSENKPAEYVNVFLKGTSKGAVSDNNGKYEIKDIAPGNYTVVVSAINYEIQKKDVQVKAGEILTLNFVLSESVTEMKTIVITSTGVTKSSQDIPGAVSVIDSKAIEESGAQNINEIIARVPGVNILDEDGRGLKPDIGLRGLNPNRDRNTLVLVDGKFPVGMTLYGDPAGYYFMPLQQVDRIEIIKGGAASVLYGGYSVGGIVNLISKKATYEPQTQVDLTYGSWNGLVAQVTSGRDNGKSYYYINGNRRQGKSFRENGDFAVNDITAKFGARPDPTSEISVYLNGFSEDSKTPGGLSPLQFKEDITQSNNPNDHFYSKRFSGGITYTKNLNNFNKFNVSFYGNYFERNWFIATKNPVRNGFVRDIHNVGVVADYKRSNKFLNHKNALIVGTRIHGDRLDDVNIAQDTADFTTQTGTTTGNKVNNSMIYEFYIYDEFHLTDELIFTPGARMSSIGYSRKDLMKDREDEININALVYTAGLVYKPKKHTSIFANLSSGFQPPQLNSALDPGTIDAGADLGPETSINYETGIKTTPTKWISASITGYYIQFQNKIIKESGINKNAGESLHRGIETELEFGSWKGFSLFTNATFQKATFKSDTRIQGNLLPYAPQQLFAAGLRYKTHILNGELLANVFGNHVSKQFNDDNNTETETDDGQNGAIPAYQVINASVVYSAKKWGMNFSVYNLLNEKYFTQRNGFFGGIMPLPPRNIRFKVFYRL